MGVIPSDKEDRVANGAGKPLTFWQRIARALDGLAAQRSQKAVPAIALLRSKHDIDRCRRLMLEASRAAPTIDDHGARAGGLSGQ